MARKTKPAPDMQPNNALLVEQSKEETGAQALARKVLAPGLRHAMTSAEFAGKALGKAIKAPGIMDYYAHVSTVADQAEAGDLAMITRMLAAQAITLDSMFTELARRAALNMGEYIDASERYGRLALKAQSNSRATLEALVKIHQPREQTVRHVHVNEGGQAIVSENFHHHAAPRVTEGAEGNGPLDKQSTHSDGARLV